MNLYIFGIILASLLAGGVAAAMFFLVWNQSNAKKAPEDPFRQIFKSSPAPQLIVSDDGRVRFCNSSLLMLLGRELNGESPDFAFRDIFRDDTSYENLMVRLRKYKYLSNHELTLVNSANEAMSVLGNFRMLPGTPGGFEGFQGSIIDITPIKKNHDALRESEDRFRSTADNIPVLIWMSDSEGGCIYFNQPWLDFTGRELNQELGDGWADGVYRDDLKRCIATYQAAFNEQKNLKREYRLRRADGQYRWILDTGVPRVLSDGTFAGMIGSCLDITDRKQSEELLRKSRDELQQIKLQYQAILKSTPHGLCILRANWTISWANGSLNHILNIENDKKVSLLGLSFKSLFVTEKDFRAYADSASQTVRRMGGDMRPLQLKRMNGDIFWAEISIVSLDPSQTEPGYVATITDISERKQAEDEKIRLESQIQQNEKLESLGILAGGIAHDFSNLLVAILGHANLAMQDVPFGSPGRQSISLIERTAQRAAELTRQLLAYSGRGKFVVEAVNVSHLVEDVISIMESTISKQAVLRFHLDAHVPPFECDATQIRQVVMNLVTNASDALADEPGTISVTTGTMYADRGYLSKTYLDDNLQEGYYAFLQIADTGCGMSEETKEKIFDPFFTTKFTGRGLGLAAVLGIVRGHRGAIKVTAAPGKGTTFRILFPCVVGNARSKPAAPPPLVEPPPLPLPIQSSAMPEFEERRATVREIPVKPPMEVAQEERRATMREIPMKSSKEPALDIKGTVLVVDDEEAVRKVAKLILERAGITVLTAEDGHEAVRICKDAGSELSLVILDITMPHPNGEETLAALKLIQPDIKVILCSGYSEEEAVQRFDGKGVAGFIRKPYRTADFIRVVQQMIQEDKTPLASQS